MKPERKVKKLMLRKETLRDLTAVKAGEVKGGRPTYGKKCKNTFGCSGRGCW